MRRNHVPGNPKTARHSEPRYGVIANRRELAELYGIQTSQGAPQVQALVSCMYDLLNGMIVHTRFAHCRSSERAAAKDMIGSFRLQNVSNPVFTMDRGYPAPISFL